MSSAKSVILVRDGDVFKPYSDFDREKIQRYPQGKALRHQISQLRSVPRNNLYWAVLRLVLENNDHFIIAEKIHDMMLTALNVVDWYIDIEGVMQAKPSSTAFENMSEEDFKTYFDAVVTIICTKIMPGMDPDELIKEAKERCGMKQKQEAA